MEPEITIENDQLTVHIKSKGAELCNVISKETQLEYMWRGDPAVWGKTSPVLFPIVGALREDAFIYSNKKYYQPRHGFARDRIFEVAKQEKDSVIFLLTSNAASFQNYPFVFELRLKYELRDNNMNVTYAIRNTGKDDMYFSIGGHPAFSVPLMAGSKYEDHYLEFDKVESIRRWPISKDGLIENEPADFLQQSNRINLTRDLFHEDALVFKHLQSNKISLKCNTHNHGLDLSFDGFPFLGIWAAKNGDFVCIEPWCGIADSVGHNQQFVEKEGIEKIAPGKSWLKTWSVKFY